MLVLLLKLVVLLASWLLGVAAWIVWVGERDQAAPADAIVVLGAAAYDARPSPVLQERLRHALDLYRRGYAGTLIFTGGYGFGARFSESQVARRYALREGVPEEAVLIETLSRTTYENLAQARLLMQERGIGRVIVVSDPLHMARALRLSRMLGIDALGSSTPSTRFRSLRTRWRFLAREVYFFHRDLVITPR
ncbi:YdcF family protein [soil metagenome]